MSCSLNTVLQHRMLKMNWRTISTITQNFEVLRSYLFQASNVSDLARGQNKSNLPTQIERRNVQRKSDFISAALSTDWWSLLDLFNLLLWQTVKFWQPIKKYYSSSLRWKYFLWCLLSAKTRAFWNISLFCIIQNKKYLSRKYIFFVFVWT